MNPVSGHTQAACSSPEFMNRVSPTMVLMRWSWDCADDETIEVSVSEVPGPGSSGTLTWSSGYALLFG